MRLVWTLVLALIFGLSDPSAAQRYPDQLVEDNEYGTIDLNPVVPHTPGEGYGMPRAIPVDTDGDGNITTSDKVFLFATGVDDFNANPVHDKVWRYENPNTWGGWNNAYGNRTQILPEPGTGCETCDPNDNYAFGWPYHWNGQLHLIAGIGEDPPGEQHHWHKMVLGAWDRATDTWSWQSFLRTADTWNFLRLTWQPLSINGQDVLWGFVEQKDRAPGAPATVGLAAIRYRPALSLLEVVVGGQWVSVNACSSSPVNEGYQFCLYTDHNDPHGSRIVPDFIQGSIGSRFPSFHKLAQHGDALELWASENRPDGGCGVDDPSQANLMNAFIYRGVETPTAFGQIPKLAPIRTLRHETLDPIRCNPHDRGQQRKGAFRLDWTSNLFYSRTWDDPNDPVNGAPFCCGPGTVGEPEGYIVRSFLGNLFSEDFDDHGLSRWSFSQTTGPGVDLTVTPAASFNSSPNGLQLSMNGGTGSAYVEDDSPDDEKSYWVTFQLRDELTAMADGETHQIFVGYDGTDKALRLQIKKASNGSGLLLLVARARLDDGTWSAAAFDILANQNKVTLQWQAASGPGQNDGLLRLYRGDLLKGEVLGLDNDLYALDSIRLGAVAGLDATTTGRLDFDDFVSSQSSTF